MSGASGASGAGRQGLIIITYTPLSGGLQIDFGNGVGFNAPANDNRAAVPLNRVAAR
jgi:hypothetical protein